VIPLYLLFVLDHLGSLRFLVLGQAFNHQVPKADFEATQKVGITLSLDHRLGLRDLWMGLKKIREEESSIKIEEEGKGKKEDWNGLEGEMILGVIAGVILPVHKTLELVVQGNLDLFGQALLENQTKK